MSRTIEAAGGIVYRIRPYANTPQTPILDSVTLPESNPRIQQHNANASIGGYANATNDNAATSASNTADSDNADDINMLTTHDTDVIDRESAASTGDSSQIADISPTPNTATGLDSEEEHDSNSSETTHPQYPSQYSAQMPTPIVRHHNWYQPSDSVEQSLADRIELCVVHRPKYDDWSWPKGKLEPNETHRHAAVREMGEETGVPVVLGPILGAIEYPMNSEGRHVRRSGGKTGKTKHVVYWMARPIDEASNSRRFAALGPVLPADISEIDEVAWVSIRQARKLLSHPLDRDILDLFVDRIEEGAVESECVLMVRHGKAESRKQWAGTDADRPITPKGAAAAYALNRELACFNPTRLVTSPWVRCAQTLQVLSWQTGIPMQFAEALTEDAFDEQPEESWDCFLKEVESALASSETTAICMHRPVIGGMVNHLRDMCVSKAVARQLVPSSPYMPTGTAIALFIVRTPQGPSVVDIQKVTPLVY